MELPEGAEAVRRVLLMARSAQARPGMARTVVAIDGFAGSGKSTLAARVALCLGGAAVIHTDDFANWDNPLGWWPRLIEQVLVPLSQGQDARYQRFDWEQQQLAEWHEIEPGGFLIIEGFSASRREFRPYLALQVWVAAARDVCLQRGLERDGPEALEYRKDWQAAEDARGHRPARARGRPHREW